MQLWPHYATQDLFKLAPKDLIGNIRKLHITGVVNPPVYWVNTSWNVSFGPENKQVNMSIGKANCAEECVPAGFDKAREKLEVRLKAEMEAVMSRAGHNKLRKRDLDTLWDLFEPDDEEFRKG
jgi:hypothetical protein